MTANVASIAELINDGLPPGCVTCVWYQALPEPEREAFDRYVEYSRLDPRQYSRARLFDKCVEMGYPLQLSAFRDCLRRHHVDK